MLILKIPEIEDRKMSTNRIIRFFLPPLFTHKSDDTFILYQCAKTSFLITLFLLVLNLFVYLMTEVYLDDFIEKLLIQPASTIANTLFFIVIPFYLVKYFYNINPKTVDVSWWYKQLTSKTKQKRYKVIPLYVFGLLTLIFGVYWGRYAPLFFSSYELTENIITSSFYFVMFLCMFVVFYSAIPIYIIFFIVSLYRYIGPYKKEISSNYIQNGEQK